MLSNSRLVPPAFMMTPPPLGCPPTGCHNAANSPPFPFRPRNLSRTWHALSSTRFSLNFFRDLILVFPYMFFWRKSGHFCPLLSFLHSLIPASRCGLERPFSGITQCFCFCSYLQSYSFLVRSTSPNLDRIKLLQGPPPIQRCHFSFLFPSGPPRELQCLLSLHSTPA